MSNTKTINEYTYYAIESPRGIMSDRMTEREVEYCKKQGYFTLFLWRGDKMEAYATKRYKVGKVYRYTERTTLTEELV
jgi:hypothetical protein